MSLNSALNSLSLTRNPNDLMSRTSLSHSTATSAASATASAAASSKTSAASDASDLNLKHKYIYDIARKHIEKSSLAAFLTGSEKDKIAKRIFTKIKRQIPDNVLKEKFWKFVCKDVAEQVFSKEDSVVNPPVPLAEPLFYEFSKQSNLVNAMAALEEYVSKIKQDNEKHGEAACKILNIFQAHSQLAGWKVLDFFLVSGKEEYLKQIEIHSNTNILTFPKQSKEMEQMLAKVQTATDSIIKKVQAFLAVKKNIDPIALVDHIAKDDFLAKSKDLLKEAEQYITTLLAKNAQKFNEYRELQRKGVGWPHGKTLKREILNAGFTYRPMMVKRDQCECSCGLKKFGWRQWSNPWLGHDFSKHDEEFREYAKYKMQQYGMPNVPYQMDKDKLTFGDILPLLNNKDSKDDKRNN